MKKKLTGILLLLLFIALPLQGQAKVKAPKKQCHAYVVMDAGSGEVLFGQDANKKIYPASTAKLMTRIFCTSLLSSAERRSVCTKQGNYKKTAWNNARSN